jgi:hypothetical protein
MGDGSLRSVLEMKTRNEDEKVNGAGVREDGADRRLTR